MLATIGTHLLPHIQVVLGVDVGGETEGEIMISRRNSMRGRLPMHVIHSVSSSYSSQPCIAPLVWVRSIIYIDIFAKCADVDHSVNFVVILSERFIRRGTSVSLHHRLRKWVITVSMAGGGVRVAVAVISGQFVGVEGSRGPLGD